MKLAAVPSKFIAFSTPIASFAFLAAFPQCSFWFAAVPFILMITKGVDITITNGIILSALWILYLLVVLSPFSFLLGRYYILVVYLPMVLVVYFKEPHAHATKLFLANQTVLWDIPLLVWIRIVSSFGGRALKVCISGLKYD